MQPPRLFQRLFQWLCRPDLKKHIEGDLIELYQERVRLNGKTKADLQFMKDVLLLMRPGIIRSFKPAFFITQFRYGMLKNHFKSGWRNLARHKTFTAINILGLSVGICASLIIFLIVEYDYSFDKFEKDNHRIYRVVEKYTLKVSGQHYGSSAMPDLLPAMVEKEVTGLETVVGLTRANATKITVNTTATGKKKDFENQDKIVYTNANYFEMVGYRWVAGNALTALREPYTVVLSANTAKLYFPEVLESEVIGKELYFEDSVRLTVTGIVSDLDANTVFNYNTFISRTTLETARMKPRFWDRWNHSQATLLYVKLAGGTGIAQINRQINNLFNRYNQPNSGDPERRAFDLQPLKDAHFKTYYDSSSTGLADKSVLSGLQAVATFLLLLACINFINLTTAQASRRSKEIGIRKTMGSSRFQLMIQFIGETFLVTCISALLALAATPLFLRAFQSFIPQITSLGVWKQPEVMVFLLILVIVVSVLAGIYPALILSSFKPVSVLKNQVNAETGMSAKAGLRKGLTIFQFVIAQVFILATLLVGKQIRFTLGKDIGMKKDAVLYFGNYIDTSASKKILLLTKLQSIPGIEMASLSMDPPSSTSTWIDEMKYTDGNRLVQTNVQVKVGDSNYIKLYRIGLVAGRNLANNDTMGDLLINETYLHGLGFTDPKDVLGRFINVYGNKRVVGVVKDFNQKSLREIIMPLLITGGISSENTFNVSLQPQPEGFSTWKETIGQMRQAWKEVYPDRQFEYRFLDDAIAEYYTAEQQLSTLLIWSSGLTIFISCLGLLGLVIYVTNQRTKEIGIRKVVGATVLQLVALLSAGFIKLVVVAFLIATPIAWWGVNAWLQGFAYRTKLSWWIFPLGGGILVLLALIIMAFKVFRVANASMVRILRSE